MILIILFDLLSVSFVYNVGCFIIMIVGVICIGLVCLFGMTVILIIVIEVIVIYYYDVVNSYCWLDVFVVVVCSFYYYLL